MYGAYNQTLAVSHNETKQGMDQMDVIPIYHIHVYSIIVWGL